MQTTVRLLKPWMARPVGSLVSVGTVEADLLIERGAAEAVSAESEERGEINGPPSTPPQTTAGATAPPQTKHVPAPTRGRLAAPRRK